MNKKIIFGLGFAITASILCCGVIIVFFLFSADLIGPKADMRSFRNKAKAYEGSVYNCIYELSRLVSSPPKREFIEDRLNLCQENANGSLEDLSKSKAPTPEVQYFLDLSVETIETYKSALDVNYTRTIESLYSDIPRREEDINIGQKIEESHDTFTSALKVFDSQYLND